MNTASRYGLVVPAWSRIVARSSFASGPIASSGTCVYRSLISCG